MCGGADHHGKDAHHQSSSDRHRDCSCGRLGGLGLLWSCLMMLSMVTHVACDKGEITELLKSNSAFRGAVSLDLSPGEANFNLLQSLTTERIWKGDKETPDIDRLFINTAVSESVRDPQGEVQESREMRMARKGDTRLLSDRDTRLLSDRDTRLLTDRDTRYSDPKKSVRGDDGRIAMSGNELFILGDPFIDPLEPESSRGSAEGDEDDEEEGMNGSRVAHVVGASVVMLCVSALGVSLPTLIRRFARNSSQSRRDRIRKICCAFAAGGFWGLALIHVLVEAVNGCSLIKYGITFKSGAFMNAAFALCALGYLIMLTIQSIASISSQKAALRGSDEGTDFKAAMFDAAVASVALTFHSFFEGMVVGMRDTHLLIWVATISVIGHKWAAGFALSMRMEVHQTPKVLKWTTLSIFVLASPIGALIGMPLGTMETSGSAVVLNCLSAGILIFVAGETTMEVFGSGNSGDCCGEASIWKSSLEEGTQEECNDPCCVNRDVLNTVRKPLAPPPSFRVFLAQITSFIVGLALVFAMMTLHLKNPGHEHPVE